MTTRSLRERLRGSAELDPLALGTAGSRSWRQQLQQWWLGTPYGPLDATKRQLRIIKLIPPSSSDADLLKCIIKTHSLNSTLKYAAISYCWGSAVDPRVIDVGGRQVPITNNLHTALMTLQRTGATQDCLWIYKHEPR